LCALDVNVFFAGAFEDEEVIIIAFDFVNDFAVGRDQHPVRLASCFPFHFEGLALLYTVNDVDLVTSPYRTALRVPVADCFQSLSCVTTESRLARQSKALPLLLTTFVPGQ
jgi:hypothetical protein